NQSGTRRSKRVPSRNRRLGFDINNQFVEVRALLDTGGFHLVGDLQNRRVNGVDRDTTNLSIVSLVLQRGNIPAATLNGQLDLKLAFIVQSGDMQIRVVYVNTGRWSDISTGHVTGALLTQVHHDGLIMF